MKETEVKREPLPKPCCPLGVVSLSLAIILCVRMHESGQRAPVDHKPGNESAKLSWREQVHFKHSHWVRSNGSIPQSIYAQLGDCSSISRIEMRWSETQSIHSLRIRSHRAFAKATWSGFAWKGD